MRRRRGAIAAPGSDRVPGVGGVPGIDRASGVDRVSVVAVVEQGPVRTRETGKARISRAARAARTGSPLDDEVLAPSPTPPADASLEPPRLVVEPAQWTATTESVASARDREMGRCIETSPRLPITSGPPGRRSFGSRQAHVSGRLFPFPAPASWRRPCSGNRTSRWRRARSRRRGSPDRLR